MPGAANQLGRKLRALRHSFGLTQEQLAEEADISLKHLGEIERGRGNPTLTTLEALAKALHVTVSDLTAHGDGLESESVISVQVRALVEKQEKSVQRKVLHVLQAMLGEE